ncbi:hypothetical protein SLEP1_g57530 [Rubroshorea leprosula]|uniref:Uncharacterized protein n=1 Tax=Rubroshorea leprosula TaxID=152421 RepID=A0AAV5MR36_9ROSI|nr:hypothetical protein SLEP1_g57530 [Rubroshorea leprosula]
MRSQASEYGADMIIAESGFREIADPFSSSVPIQYEEVA